MTNQSPNPSANDILPADSAVPSLARRFGALLIDWILCVLVSRIFGNPLVTGWAPPTVLIIEYGFFLGLFGQTPGMWITKIRCVGVKDGRPIGILWALLRGLLLTLVIPGLIMDKQRRGLHDKAVGSVIVDAPRHA